MDTQWRSIPGRVTLTALTLLAATSFTGLLAPPAAVACAPARPEDDSSPYQVESPNERERGECRSR